LVCCTKETLATLITSRPVNKSHFYEDDQDARVSAFLCKRRRRPPKNVGNHKYASMDRCYDLTNILAKFLGGKLAFLLVFCNNVTITMAFEKSAFLGRKAFRCLKKEDSVSQRKNHFVQFDFESTSLTRMFCSQQSKFEWTIYFDEDKMLFPGK
jgi:hypothetical protein